VETVAVSVLRWKDTEVERYWVNWIKLVIINRHGNRAIFMRTMCDVLPGKQDVILSYIALLVWGTAVAQWLRCCVTNRKVAGSIPAGVSGFFIDIKSF